MPQYQIFKKRNKFIPKIKVFGMFWVRVYFYGSYDTDKQAHDAILFHKYRKKRL